VTAMMVHRAVTDAAVAIEVHPCGILDGAEHRMHGRRAVVMHDLRRRSVVMCRRRGVGGAAVLWPAVLLPAVLWPAVLWAAVVVLGSVLVIHGPVADAAIAVQVHACGIFDGVDHGVDRWAGTVTEHTADAAVTVQVHSRAALGPVDHHVVKEAHGCLRVVRGLVFEVVADVVGAKCVF
jgi:hypothetical protein